MVRTIKTKLYFAYGMNTNKEEMAVRCPSAVPMGKAVLPGYRFEFKSFATIVPDVDSQVEGVLWTITDTDEAALDLLEGYPEFYDKRHVTVRQGIDYIAMTYIMGPREQGYAPSSGYYSMVSEGYQAFGLNQKQLLDAKNRSIKEIIIYE
jgi:gamma-glutamylcyclotransferase (GGCT)/AIG2-like uncharacterized protein YtfP